MKLNKFLKMIELTEDIHSFDMIEEALKKDQPKKLKRYIVTLGSNLQHIKNLISKIPTMKYEYIEILIKDGNILNKRGVSNKFIQEVFDKVPKINRPINEIKRIKKLFLDSGFEPIESLEEA